MNEVQQTPAELLRKLLDGPIYNRALRKEVGRGELDYEIYLRTRELYALQTEASELTVGDELLFQVMHQTQELWLKSASFEVVALVAALDAGSLYDAIATLDRIVLIHRCLAEEIRILHTLTPDTFQTIRRNLGNGSGLESPGYNRMLAAAEAAEGALDRALARCAVDVKGLYAPTRKGETEDTRAGLKRIAELYIDWDDAFQSWLVAHFNLVRRTIGVHRTVKALDGFPTQALAPRMTKPLFPTLWDARVEMTQAWTREGGHAPGAERPTAPVPSATPATRVVRSERPAHITEPPVSSTDL